MAKIPRLKPVSSAEEIKPQKRVPELIRVPADRSLKAVVLCQTLFLLPTHYDGARTVICTAPEECEHCAHRSLRIYFLCAILDKLSNRVAWVQLSEHAGQSLLSQVREAERPLYGTVCEIGRVRKSMQAPISVTIDKYSTVHGKLPKPMDPSETLERVFNSPNSNGNRRKKPV